MKLATHIVEKPWGRRDIPAAFVGAVPKGETRQIGEVWYDGAEKLPLLVKWLFTSEKLSVQVHPDDDLAQASGLPSGKEECWYIVSAEKGAKLGIGTKASLSPEALRAASLSGEIEQLMDWKPVQAGDFFYIPAGTVHAIGAGITLIEIQQNADITYRLYDYGRLDKGRPRELHLDDGIAAAKPMPYSDPRCGHAVGNMQLVDGPIFRLWHIEDSGGLNMLPRIGGLWITPAEGAAMVNGHMISVGECAYVQDRRDIGMEGPAKLLIAAI